MFVNSVFVYVFFKGMFEFGNGIFVRVYVCVCVLAGKQCIPDPHSVSNPISPVRQRELR